MIDKGSRYFDVKGTISQRGTFPEVVDEGVAD